MRNHDQVISEQFGSTAAAGSTWLIATGDETAQAGAPLLLETVKPTALADWPDTLTL
ncbi:hypothetical protein [Rugosibacter aromaticivorans]|uniref:hypothetical protein n=1 Tax=Rugosibacter aromaticivorans TaxID=1565605 RepID=UPI00192A216E|nr:hypothetical protein [Rugosibacter aromaticivorans]